MLHPDISNPVWKQFFLYEEQENLSLSKYPLKELFKHDFPLFLLPYSSVEIENKFKEFLTVLNLGEELDPLFEAAIQHPTSKIKLIEDPEKKLKDEDIVLVKDAQKKLEDIFLPYLDHSVEMTSFSLKETHFQALLQALDLSSANFSTQAKTLLSYAASIAKLSSSDIFGIEWDSPRVLRIYAYALMKKAHALDPSIFISRTVEKVEMVEMVEGVIKMVGGEEV
ncbi:hypothetical protein Rin_00016420, partial [Candidatus Regiella insecticola 5.15]